MRDLLWTVVGASAGSVARHWIDPVWSGSTVGTLVLVAVSATVIGWTFVTSRRTATATALVGAGGAAASVSAAAARAATATPSPSILGMAAFFVVVVAGLTVGVCTAAATVDHARRERC